MPCAKPKAKLVKPKGSPSKMDATEKRFWVIKPTPGFLIIRAAKSPQEKNGPAKRLLAQAGPRMPDSRKNEAFNHKPTKPNTAPVTTIITISRVENRKRRLEE